MRSKQKSNIDLTTTTAEETSDLTIINNMYEAPAQQKKTQITEIKVVQTCN